MKLSKATYFQITAHLILLSFQLMFWNFIIDDAFISFRYAKNLFFNQQLVFNVNETPVEGFSNFLWVLWMTISFPLNIEIILFSKISGMIFSHLSVIVLYKLAFKINNSKNFSNVVIIFYVLTPNVALWSIGGLETSLFSFLLLISVYSFILDITIRRNKVVKMSPLFFVLLSLTRHEGVIVFGITCIFFLFLLFQNKTALVVTKLFHFLYFVGIFSIVYFPYLLWRVLYYNNLLPHTFIAKQGGFSLLSLAERILFYVPLLIFLFPILFINVSYYVIHSRFQFRNEKKLYLLLVILTLCILLLILTSWMPGFRFTVPILPLAYLLLPKSLNFLMILNKNKKKNTKIRKNVKILTILAICASNASLLVTFYPFVQIYGTGIRECNITLGKWISENTPSNASLAVWDAGTIPFYSDIRTIDIYPDSLQDLHLYNNPEDANYILDQNITFLILNDEYFSYIKTDIRFINNYSLIFYAQFYYADGFYGQDYIYQIYLFNDFNVSESAINALLDSSERFYI
ncbi:MAG: hypothetical protein HWN80_05575 [Candidatus Lokiarchaeota archaeon]|nr:hypothetical protein [Candidatus Lokiarchaeota archaeon]